MANNTDATTRVCAEVINRRKSLIFNVPPTRYTPVNPYAQGYTQAQLDMRRKAEVLQYNKSSNGKITSKKKWVNVVNGIEQRRKFSSYVLKQIADGTAEPCPNDLYIPTLTTASDVPGPPMYLYYDPTVPLYNYNSQQNSYGSENTTTNVNWLLSYDTDIAENSARILTMNIQRGIDQSSYTYSITTSVSLQIAGSNDTSLNGSDASGVFNVVIPPQNIGLQVTYGEQPVATTPNITFEPGFLTDVSGKTFTKRPGTFEGTIFMGNITFSGILLNTVPGYMYDFNITYIPSYSTNNIERFGTQLVSNVKNTALLQETELVFLTPVSASDVKTLVLNGL